MEILIPTCDKYIKYTEATMVSSRNLWPAGYKFRILGFKEPKFKLDENWSFTRIGKKDQGPKSWGTGMRWFMSNYPNEHFIYGSDDCALTMLNFNFLETAIRICQSYSLVGRFSLTADKTEGKTVTDFFDETVFCYSYAEGANYRLSLGWSIYNTRFFKMFLKDEMTPWQYEKQSCGPLNIHPYEILTFEPKAAIDAAYFCRKDKGVIENWFKGYGGHDLQGEMKQIVQGIIFAK